MKIMQVINNNVVSVQEKNQELVIMGRGVGFQKKVGALVDEDKIEKVFTLNNQDDFERLKQLLLDIPLECFVVTEEIIKYAEKKLSTKLNEGLYVSLADHIDCAVERSQQGLDIKNGLLFETKQVYKEQFNIGLEALKMIEKRLGVKLLPDEAAFIAIHLVNAEHGIEMPLIVESTKIMQEITTIVGEYFQIEFDEESIHYHRFIMHLKFFAQRLLSGKTLDGEDDFLFEAVKLKYPEVYQCVEKISDFLKNARNYDMTKQEALYLSLHIERILRNC